MNKKYLIVTLAIALIAITATSAFDAITWFDIPAVNLVANTLNTASPNLLLSYDCAGLNPIPTTGTGIYLLPKSGIQKNYFFSTISTWKVFYVKNITTHLVESSVKSLVVYYSRTGNAKFVAETIAAELGSDIEEVVDLKSREGKLGWLSAGRDGSSGRETKIAPTKKVPSDYDLLIIGTPVWAWSPTAAIRTYLKNNDLSGKKVALFFTLDNNLRQAVEKTKALMPNSVFVGELDLIKALANKEETEKKVAAWCDTLKTT